MLNKKMKTLKILKTSLLLLAMLPFAASAQSQSKLAVEDFTISAGETKTLAVDLINPDFEVTALQFDITLPEGLSIPYDEDEEEYQAEKTSRCTSKHSLSSNRLSNGDIRFALKHEKNKLITGTEGAVINITIVASSSFQSGTIRFSNIVLASPNETQVLPADFEIIIAPAPRTITDEDGAVYFVEEGNKVSFAGNTNAGSTYNIPETVTQDGMTYTVTTIAGGAFQGNTGLTEITIPESIVAIGGNAFGDCSSLKTINVKATVPPTLDESGLLAMRRATASSVFAGVNKETCVVNVPKGCVEAYKNAYGWGEFVNITDGTSGIHAITVDGKSGNIYDLQGRKVTDSQLSRGVYIMNARKYVVK